LEGLGMENVGILYAHLEYITAIWYILWSSGNLVSFSPFWNKKREKSGNPDPQ
jgi:hypothetical protein